MHIEWLRVEQLRNLGAVYIEPGARINIFYGTNGSGKTALLEALHILSRCRSFRTARVDRVVNRAATSLKVSAALHYPDTGTVITGVERGPGCINIRFAGETVSRVSDQAARIPLITITPDSHELITGGPTHRRKWLDWAMFHVEPGYIDLWRRYHKALKQRNHVLKQGDMSVLAAWEEQLDETGRALTGQRHVYLAELNTQLQRVCAQLAIHCPEIVYRQGWPEDETLLDTLARSRAQERLQGTTRYGLHRSDLRISTAGTAVAHHYSRGQIKLLVNALVWSQSRVLHARGDCCPILLADDLLAELDAQASQALLGLYSDYPGQVFISAITPPGAGGGDLGRLFHVKHGQVDPC